MRGSLHVCCKYANAGGSRVRLVGALSYFLSRLKCNAVSYADKPLHIPLGNNDLHVISPSVYKVSRQRINSISLAIPSSSSFHAHRRNPTPLPRQLKPSAVTSSPRRACIFGGMNFFALLWTTFPMSSFPAWTFLLIPCNGVSPSLSGLSIIIFKILKQMYVKTLFRTSLSFASFLLPLP